MFVFRSDSSACVASRRRRTALLRSSSVFSVAPFVSPFAQSSLFSPRRAPANRKAPVDDASAGSKTHQSLALRDTRDVSHWAPPLQSRQQLENRRIRPPEADLVRRVAE